MFDGVDELRGWCGDGGDLRRGWEFVRALAAAFGRPVIEGGGIEADLLQVGEDRIGIRLPAALREAYLLFGRRRDLTAAQDSLGEHRMHGQILETVPMPGSAICVSRGAWRRARGERDSQLSRTGPRPLQTRAGIPPKSRPGCNA